MNHLCMRRSRRAATRISSSAPVKTDSESPARSRARGELVLLQRLEPLELLLVEDDDQPEPDSRPTSRMYSDPKRNAVSCGT